MVGTKAASCALMGGSTKRARTLASCIASPIAKAPRTGRNSPDKESSPANSCCASATSSKSPWADKIPKAIGKSKRPESFGKSAGPKFTVMRLLLGNARPAFSIAHRTRSRASFTSVSARPTNVKQGNPLAKCTSTVTDGACMPRSARL